MNTTPETITVTVNGVALALVDRGAGPPVVLIHGFPLDHTMWAAQLDAMAAHYRVLAPDLRGFGRSDVTPGMVTMEQFADDIAALLDALRITEPAVYVGLSMGGYIGLAFWRKYAPRLRALVLCDTRAAADAPEAAAARRDMAARVLGEGPAPLVEAMTPRLWAPATIADRPQLVAAFRAVMLGADPRGIAAAAHGMAARPDSTPLLSQIACPALLIGGAEDVLSPPPQMQAIADAIAGARFVAIPGAGHMAPVENPAAVNAALTAFLASL